MRGRDEVRDQVGRGMAFQDEVGWMGFVGTSEEGLGVDQACPDRGVAG